MGLFMGKLIVDAQFSGEHGWR